MRDKECCGQQSNPDGIETRGRGTVLKMLHDGANAHSGVGLFSRDLPSGASLFARRRASFYGKELQIYILLERELSLFAVEPCA